MLSHQLVLLILLSSLQLGRLQEEGCDDCSLFQNINNNIVNLNSLIRSYIKRSEQSRGQMEESISSLRRDLKSLNETVSNLSVCFQEHKKQVNSKLDTLTTIQQCDFQSHSLTQTTFTLAATTSLNTPATTPTPTTTPHTCGGAGWRHVVNLNMTDPSATCPSGWQLTGYFIRTCGRAGNEAGTCDLATFPVRGGEYSSVCGRIKAYQWGGTDAFINYHKGLATTIDSAYVSGVSVTHGYPQQHIWTFAAGAAEGNPHENWVCPCDADHTISIPPFVGNDYFCESGLNGPWDDRYILRPNDPLWDGENCLSNSTCCSLHNPPYFVKQLPTSTTDNIEARICIKDNSDGIAVELIDLYVQ